MGHTVHDSKPAYSSVLFHVDANQGRSTGLQIIVNLSYLTVPLELLIKILHLLSVSPVLVHTRSSHMANTPSETYIYL